MSEIKSAPLANGRIVRRTASTVPWRLAGIGAVVVGGLFWLIGARNTVIGAPYVLWLLLGLFEIDLFLRLPVGWPLLALTVVVGAIVSAVEFICYPRRSFFAKSLIGACVLALLWVLCNVGDWTSTFVAVQIVSPASGPLARWVATTAAAAVLWTCFLTWVPELLIIVGIRWLLNGRF